MADIKFQTFGQKAYNIGETPVSRVLNPKLQDKIGGDWAFRKDKLYFLNIQGAFFKRDIEEALDRFFKYCDHLLQNPPEGAVVEATQKPPKSPKAPKPLKFPKTHTFAQKAKQVPSDYSEEEGEVTTPKTRTEQLTELFGEYNIELSPKGVESIKKRPAEFLGVLSNSFPEYQISFVVRDADEHITRTTTAPKTGKEKQEDPEAISLTVKKALKIYGPNAASEDYVNFYNNLSDFLEGFNKIYTMKDGSPYFNITSHVKTGAHPFKLDGSANLEEFSAYVNVIRNNVAITSRQEYGLNPYTVLETYVGSEIVPESVMTLFEKGQKQNAPTTASTSPAPYPHRAYIPREVRAIYRSPGGIRKSTQAATKGVAVVTPKMLQNFHKDMIKYFLRPGVLVYLTSEEYAKIRQQHGGKYWNILKKVGGAVSGALQQATPGVIKM